MWSRRARPLASSGRQNSRRTNATTAPEGTVTTTREVAFSGAVRTALVSGADNVTANRRHNRHKAVSRVKRTKSSRRSRAINRYVTNYATHKHGFDARQTVTPDGACGSHAARRGST